jgi:hypothetical protein
MIGPCGGQLALPGRSLQPGGRAVAQGFLPGASLRYHCQERIFLTRRAILKAITTLLAGLGAALALAIFAGSPALAQTVEETNARLDLVFGEHESFGEVFDILYQAVDAGDAPTVASLAKYPLRVATNGEEYEIDSEQTFIDNYDTIITPSIKDVIVSQDFALLFVNQDGVMYGDGDVWISPICIDDACERYRWLIVTVQE